jgi:chemotaxis response regulator CheB
LRRISDRGGMALIQDPSTAESTVMPIAAVKAVPRAKVMGLDALVKFVAQLPAGDPERDGQ